ncbi:dimeric alpha+beta barrel [Diplodia corticola]|uniref:Dimeric alpha+beta barrel n=1 Tax=Diplodia corticola TaxID=236234 RepID=A0A1J9S6W5_9PEZI|nr:dimeric alpha+beta barrel [Diplodia corticola]OJD35668.1 dimeric alpha+beta barrel [Diplodia corticola]
MAPTTENAILQLKPDVDITTGDAAATWRATLATISAQPGLQRIAWGQSLENPHIVQMLIDWDDPSSHRAFQQTPAYTTFLANISALLASAPRLTHHAFSPTTSDSSPSSPSPLPAITTASPITEVISAYAPLSQPPDALAAAWAEFAKVAAAHAAGLRGSAGAWADDEDEFEHASLREAGGKGRLFVAVVGWDGVEAHMAYRETAAFRESIGKVRAAVSGIEMHHVDFREA